MKKIYYISISTFLSLLMMGLFSIDNDAFAQNLTVKSIFISPSGEITNTTNILEGNYEEISNQYYQLGEEFDKKSGIKPGDTVSYVFKNKTEITLPYTGEYYNPASKELLEEVLIPLGQEGDKICWIDLPDFQRHWVCGWTP